MERGILTTIDHNTIRSWAESRGGRPAIVRRTIYNDPEQDRGVLRILFSDETGNETLEEVTWGRFFLIVEEKNLAFAYQDRIEQGKLSRFFDLVHRPGSKSSPRGPGRSSPAGLPG